MSWVAAIGAGASVAGGLLGGGGGGAPAGPNITGPANFRVGGLTIGAKNVGSGRAASDQSNREAAQVASEPSASGPDAGYSAGLQIPPSASATAWYQQPGVMLAGILAFAVIAGLLIKKAMSRREKTAPASK